MRSERALKRLKVRLKATDREGLAHAFGGQLRLDAVFLKTSAPLPVGTSVVLEVCYADGTPVLRGHGHVAWARDVRPDRVGGLALAIRWDAASRPLVDWLIERRREIPLDAPAVDRVVVGEVDASPLAGRARPQDDDATLESAPPVEAAPGPDEAVEPPLPFAEAPEVEPVTVPDLSRPARRSIEAGSSAPSAEGDEAIAAKPAEASSAALSGFAPREITVEAASSDQTFDLASAFDAYFSARLARVRAAVAAGASPPTADLLYEPEEEELSQDLERAARELVLPSSGVRVFEPIVVDPSRFPVEPLRTVEAARRPIQEQPAITLSSLYDAPTAPSSPRPIEPAPKVEPPSAPRSDAPPAIDALARAPVEPRRPSGSPPEPPQVPALAIDASTAPADTGSPSPVAALSPGVPPPHGERPGALASEVSPEPGAVSVFDAPTLPIASLERAPSPVPSRPPALDAPGSLAPIAPAEAHALALAPGVVHGMEGGSEAPVLEVAEAPPAAVEMAGPPPRLEGDGAVQSGRVSSPEPDARALPDRPDPTPTTLRLSLADFAAEVGKPTPILPRPIPPLSLDDPQSSDEPLASDEPLSSSDEPLAFDEPLESSERASDELIASEIASEIASGEIASDDPSEPMTDIARMPLALRTLAEPLEPPQLATLDPSDLHELPDPHTTEYAQFAAFAKDQLGPAPTALNAFRTEEILPKIPAEEQWTREAEVEWDKQSGEVTPLGRVELVRRPLLEERVRGQSPPSTEPPIPDAIPSKSDRRPLPPKTQAIVGIDLGSTSSRVAVVEAGEPRIIPSRRGTSSIPSAVLIHPEGKTIVGEPAIRRQSLFPENTIVGVKRLIGRSFNSPSLARARGTYAYTLVEGEEGEVSVRLGEHCVSLEEISALILKEIRETASLNLNQKVNRAVITCPARYGERQREAVRTAGELAGFHVERVLSEPVAAAIHYAHALDVPRRRVLVYDLGGGTFDGALIEIEGRRFRVRATAGDTFLGGLDFDMTLSELIRERLRHEHGVDLGGDAIGRTKLLQAAEQAKCDLSEKPLVNVAIEHAPEGASATTLTIKLDRASVDLAVAPFVDRTLSICKSACERAGIDPLEIDDVVLVGNQTRAPLVQRRLEQAFGKRVELDLDPGDIVALGAALYAASHDAGAPIVIEDRLSTSLGVYCPRDGFSTVVREGTPLPARRSLKVTTVRDDQAEIEVALAEGDGAETATGDAISLVRLTELPLGPSGSVTATLELSLAEDTSLTIRATDAASGRELAIEMSPRVELDELGRRFDLSGFALGPIEGEPRAETESRAAPESVRAPAEPAASEPPHAPEASPATPEHRPTAAEEGGLVGWLKKALGGPKRKSF